MKYLKLFEQSSNCIAIFEDFDYDKVKRGLKNPQRKIVLKNLEKGMPVKWIENHYEVINEEMTGYFYEYGATAYKVRTSKYGMIYVSYKNKTFQLNDLEITQNKYNL